MYDAIGYVYDGSLSCIVCCTDGIDESDPEGWYLYAHNESDSPNHCEYCGVFLGGDLTHDGVKSMKEYYETGRCRDREFWRVYVEYYRGVDWFFIHTFVGLMNPLGEFKDCD